MSSPERIPPHTRENLQFLSGLEGPQGIAHHGNSVFVVDQADDHLYRFDEIVPPVVSNPTPAQALGITNSGGVAFQNNKVFILNLNSIVANDDTLHIWDYDPATNLISNPRVRALGTRNAAGIAIQNNKLFVLDSSTLVNSTLHIWDYDPATDLISNPSSAQDLDIRGGNGLFVENNKVFVASANIQRALFIWDYDPATNLISNSREKALEFDGFVGGMSIYNNMFIIITSIGGLLAWDFDPTTESVSNPRPLLDLEIGGGDGCSIQNGKLFVSVRSPGLLYIWDLEFPRTFSVPPVDLGLLPIQFARGLDVYEENGVLKAAVIDTEDDHLWTFDIVNDAVTNPTDLFALGVGGGHGVSRFDGDFHVADDASNILRRYDYTPPVGTLASAEYIGAGDSGIDSFTESIARSSNRVVVLSGLGEPNVYDYDGSAISNRRVRSTIAAFAPGTAGRGLTGSTFIGDNYYFAVENTGNIYRWDFDGENFTDRKFVGATGLNQIVAMTTDGVDLFLLDFETTGARIQRYILNNDDETPSVTGPTLVGVLAVVGVSGIGYFGGRFVYGTSASTGILRQVDYDATAGTLSNDIDIPSPALGFISGMTIFQGQLLVLNYNDGLITRRQIYSTISAPGSATSTPVGNFGARNLRALTVFALGVIISDVDDDVLHYYPWTDDTRTALGPSIPIAPDLLHNVVGLDLDGNRLYAVQNISGQPISEHRLFFFFQKALRDAYGIRGLFERAFFDAYSINRFFFEHSLHDRYGIRGRFERSLRDVYNIRTDFERAIRDAYVIRGTFERPLRDAYNIGRDFFERTFRDSYGIRGTFDGRFRDTIAIRGLFERAFSDSFLIRGIFEKRLRDAYSVGRIFFEKRLRDAYVIRGTFESAFFDAYSLGRHFFEHSLHDRYNIRAAFERPFRDSFAIRGIFERGIRDSFAIRGIFERAMRDAYGIRGIFERAFRDAYGIPSGVGGFPFSGRQRGGFKTRKRRIFRF